MDRRPAMKIKQMTYFLISTGKVGSIHYPKFGNSCILGGKFVCEFVFINRGRIDEFKTGGIKPRFNCFKTIWGIIAIDQKTSIRTHLGVFGTEPWGGYLIIFLFLEIKSINIVGSIRCIREIDPLPMLDRMLDLLIVIRKKLFNGSCKRVDFGYGFPFSS